MHSKFNETDYAQHLLFRTPDHNGGELGNSFDDPSRPQLSRSATDDHLHQSYAMNETRSAADVSSYYEDGEQSPALSPALNKHLALRPLDPHGHQQQQQQQQHPANQPKHGRRRSRSVNEDNLHYGGDREDNAANKDNKRQRPRQESVTTGSTKPLPDKRSDEKMKERTIQLLREQRQQTATQNSDVRVHPLLIIYDAQANMFIGQGRFTPQALVVPHDEPTKVAHTFASSDGSPTDSAATSVNNSISESGAGKHGRKRSRDLDYSANQLAEMDYQQLHNESFDHVPGHIAYHGLPDPSLPLPERLHNIYPDKTHKDKAARAKAFFASLTIEQYEECGDLLLDGFRDVMDRLRQTRQQKRKAARAMEEQIAKREEWVRKKRGICELELGRLRSAGTAVVKPIKSR